ncbi:hypothetical protein GGI25_004530 [Coemansia spiralis]|uniref:Uncharacterized protein n=2 Tax=Coemansia TaxID=4863 RepID=A0A9W8KX44_9FUNG|nr:hypothetical protein EDC05_004231 [Coemansia umbellata]KAJ2620700.1 hypothetical protein GGI26_004778 [Coemansia sp. RSA 1358]KAJ2673963.1 hypothetical protein GGI25_004530 [Coemansia spiralis]
MHFSTRDPSHKLKKASYKDYSSSKLEDVCSQKQLDSPETNEVTDTKHRAVMQQFVNIVKDANIELKESQKEKIEEIEAINEELVAALEQFFANNRPDITPELLEKRQKLREQYPKMFGNITDEELDKN